MADISRAENQNFAEVDVQLGPRTFEQYHSLPLTQKYFRLSLVFFARNTTAFAGQKYHYFHAKDVFMVSKRKGTKIIE